MRSTTDPFRAVAETSPALVRVEPMDQFNEKLVRNVHPPDWKNPEPTGPLQPGCAWRRNGRAGLGRHRGGPGSACCVGRASSDGRRLPQRRLRPVQGHPALVPRRRRSARCLRNME